MLSLNGYNNYSTLGKLIVPQVLPMIPVSQFRVLVKVILLIL